MEINKLPEGLRAGCGAEGRDELESLDAGCCMAGCSIKGRFTSEPGRCEPGHGRFEGLKVKAGDGMTWHGAAGWRMPGEFEPHRGCIMIWPQRPGSWPYGAKAARRAFARTAAAIAESEHVWMLAGSSCIESARAMLPSSITILRIETDDAWARDVGPTFVKTGTGGVGSADSHYRTGGVGSEGGVGSADGYCRMGGTGNECGADGTGGVGSADVHYRTGDAGNECGADGSRGVGSAYGTDDNRGADICGIDWKFNAWGGSYNGLYKHWERDDAAASAICEALGLQCVDAHPFVLEGGSIHSDGEGTLMVTEACLLSPGRNPGLSRQEIEDKLRYFLGAEKVLWLPHGIYGDETDEHVDNVAAFVRPGEVVLSWTDDMEDPQYEYSMEDLKYLEGTTDARGRRLKVHRLPLPRVPVCVNREDLDGYSFEPGEDTREVGERLAASYANFYISNGAVIMPAFGDVNDDAAALVLGRLFAGRKIVQVPARDILLGGGNIHCITQQVPL